LPGAVATAGDGRSKPSAVPMTPNRASPLRPPSPISGLSPKLTRR